MIRSKKGQNAIVGLLFIAVQFLILIIAFNPLKTAITSAKENVTDPFLRLIIDLTPFLIIFFLGIEFFLIIRYTGAQ